MADKGILLTGAGVGAALMYLLDPRAGDRRRSLVRDQLIHTAHLAGDAVGPTSRDLTNRSYGLLAEARNLLMPGDVSDEVLELRVRAALGRWTSHPGAIEVEAGDGRVTLSGQILAHELEGLLTAVAKTRGVQGVTNELEAHKTPDGVSALQGGRPRQGVQPEFMQQYWSPTARLLSGLGGGLLSLAALRRRDLAGGVLGLFGAGMLVRALTNTPVKRLLGVDSGRRAVDIHKTINVNAPVERVYDFWANFENFPRFMSHVKEVRDLGDGRSFWRVEGPGGMPVSWNAIITVQEPNRVLAWRSIEGEPVASAGIIHFTDDDEGGTQIDVKLSYNPPAGAIGHTIAAFFGSDPKTAMDEDLVRFKSLIEEGKTTADGETVTADEVQHVR